MKKTKFWLPLFALALTFGVIGCNQSGGNSASSAPTSSKSSIPAKPKITVAAADNKTWGAHHFGAKENFQISTFYSEMSCITS